MRMVHVLDAPDLHAESTFWASLLDGTVEAEEDLHSVVVDGEWRLGFQLAPNHVPPVWPVYADPAGHPFCLCRAPLAHLSG